MYDFELTMNSDKRNQMILEFVTIHQEYCHLLLQLTNTRNFYRHSLFDFASFYLCYFFNKFSGRNYDLGSDGCGILPESQVEFRSQKQPALPIVFKHGLIIFRMFLLVTVLSNNLTDFSTQKYCHEPCHVEFLFKFLDKSSENY